MSSSQQSKVVNLVAGEDLRGNVYHVLKIENDAGEGKVIKSTATTDTIVGVLAEEPRDDISTDGLGVPVAQIAAGGVLVMKAGATITAGQLIVADTTAGRVAGVADAGALPVDSMAIGVALENAADGDEFRVLAGNIAAPHTA